MSKNKPLKYEIINTFLVRIFGDKNKYFGNISSSWLTISKNGHLQLQFNVLRTFQHFHQTQQYFGVHFVHTERHKR